MSVGDIINNARVRRRWGLRALARELGIVPSYLSDIENDRRVPSETVLRGMARVLELDFDRLMQEAGRLGEGTEQYLRQERGRWKTISQNCAVSARPTSLGEAHGKS